MNAVLYVAQASLLHVIEPSDRSVSNHPSSPHGLGLLLHHGRTGSTIFTVCIPFRDHRVTWASPLPSRLAATTGRIEFVKFLRTGRSPPVALHPLSRGRSYLQLQSPNQTPARTYTSLIRCAHRRTRPDRDPAFPRSAELPDHDPAYAYKLGPSRRRVYNRVRPRYLSSQITANSL